MIPLCEMTVDALRGAHRHCAASAFKLGELSAKGLIGAEKALLLMAEIDTEQAAIAEELQRRGEPLQAAS